MLRRHKFRRLMTAIALLATTVPGRASEWNYGCKGALPVFDGSELIIFNRQSLFLLPKTWLKGKLNDLLGHDPSDEVIAVADAVNINSGLAPTLVFTLRDHPEKKLTLTEKSSRTISDVRQRAGGAPRFVQNTVYAKVYHYVSDFGFLDPFDVKMDCLNYELSAPIR
jgi:hypothetical protein